MLFNKIATSSTSRLARHVRITNTTNNQTLLSPFFTTRLIQKHSFSSNTLYRSESSSEPTTLKNEQKRQLILDQKIETLEKRLAYLNEMGSSSLKTPGMALELYSLFLESNRLSEAEKMLLSEFIPQSLETYGDCHLQVAKLYEELALIQFYLKKNVECLQSLFEVVRIRQLALQSGLEEMRQKIIESTLAVHYVSFLSDFLVNEEVPLSETELNRLYYLYTGGGATTSAGVNGAGAGGAFPKLDPKVPLHQLALAFPEKSRFKMAQQVLQGKIEKLEKFVDPESTLFERSAVASSAELNEINRLISVLYTKLAALFDRQMRYTKSFETYKKAIEYSNKYNGVNSVSSCEIMTDMAFVLSKARINEEECVSWAKKAIVGLNQIPKDELDKQPHLELKIAKCLTSLAQAKINTDPKNALTLAVQAMKICERIESRSSLGWITNAYVFAEAYDNMSESDPEAMALATKMYDEIEDSIHSCPTPSLLRLPLKSSPEFERMLGDDIIDVAARTFFPSPIATHYINLACRYVAYYLDANKAVDYMERALFILDDEQSDDHFSLEREFAATQLASMYVILQNDVSMEHLRKRVMRRLKRVLGPEHPFYLDQQRVFENLKSTIELAGRTQEERFANLEAELQKPEFKEFMQEALMKEMEKMEKAQKDGTLDQNKEQEIEDLTEKRLEELLNGQNTQEQIEKVLGFKIPPLEELAGDNNSEKK